MKNVFYIHGAFASQMSFNFIYPHLPEHNAAHANYDCNVYTLEQCIELTRQQAQEAFGGESYSVIGHSMGAIIAKAFTLRGEPIEKLITMSAPFGGLYYVRLLKYLSRKRTIYDDLVPSSEPLKTIRETSINVPTLNMITILGNRPIIFKENDAIVPVASMKEGKFGDYVQFQEVKCNHSEVLICPDTVEYIREFLGLEFVT